MSARLRSHWWATILCGMVVFTPIGMTQEEGPPPRFVTKEGRFSIQFPARHQESKVPVQSQPGELLVVVYSTRFEDATYAISYCDLPDASTRTANLEALLDRARDGAAAQVKGMIAEEKPIQIGKPERHPGREFALVRDNEPIARSRIYVVGNRLYQLLVIGPTTATSSQSALAFLNSLKLTQ